MKVYSCPSDSGNVGDDFNQWLWPRLIPRFFDDEEGETFVGIGSVFDDRYSGDHKKYVFGAGARSDCSLPKLGGDWQIFFVRGPLTAESIKTSKVKSITDPGILASLYFSRKPGANKIGLIPYYKGNHDFWRSVAEDLDMIFISPHLTVEEFFYKLSGCSSVITESLHGAIFSDALRIPWKGIVSYSKVAEGGTNNFKWNDWFGSMELLVGRLVLPVIWPSGNLGLFAKVKLLIKKMLVKKHLSRLVDENDFCLSDDKVHREKVDEILIEVERLKQVKG